MAVRDVAVSDVAVRDVAVSDVAVSDVAVCECGRLRMWPSAMWPFTTFEGFPDDLSELPCVGDELRDRGDGIQSGGGAQRRIQACMAMPAATPALMERVEPNWEIDTTCAAAALAGADRPGPS